MLCVEGNRGRSDGGQPLRGEGPQTPQIVPMFGTYPIYCQEFCSDNLRCRSRQLFHSAAKKCWMPLTGTAETKICAPTEFLSSPPLSTLTNLPACS